MPVHLAKTVHVNLAEHVDALRLEISQTLDAERRSRMGQFFTPAAIGRFMASLFEAKSPSLRLLDAGAGIGSLSAAFVERICSRRHPPKDLSVTAYEIDKVLAERLEQTLAECRAACEGAEIEFCGEVRQEDFLRAGAEKLGAGLFETSGGGFTCAIMNPPYHKILSNSSERRLLRSIGVETTNLYTGFLAVAIRLLEPGGELVAITPRSFCNGPYFKAFRKEFLREMTIRRLHVFESREAAFRDDEVLQENIIIYAVKGAERGRVILSSSSGPKDFEGSVHEVDYAQVVRPDDPESFIHVTPNGHEAEAARRMRAYPEKLDDLGLSVSTGPVVDFRASRWLRELPGDGTVPLIYPCHFENGFIRWPKPDAKKPNAIVRCPPTESLLVPTGTYVLVKRFSAKEERRRIVAAIFDPKRVEADVVGFENHLNFFHVNGRGLPTDLAKGLAIFLNSSLVDRFFRQFSGHTQVNATDLRNIRYPSAIQLKAMGSWMGDVLPTHEKIDAIVEEEA